MKKCPYCAEEIQDDAIKCRFCGEYLKKKNKLIGCLLSCFITFIVSIVVIILFTCFSFLIFKFILYKIFFIEPVLPDYYGLPFSGGGIPGILRDFAEAFKALWEKLMDVLRFIPENQRITF